MTRVEAQDLVGDGIALDGHQRVQLFERRHVNHLPPELGADEWPRHPDQRLQPEGRVNDIATLQRLPKAAVEQLVALLQPRKRRRVFAI